MDTYWGVVVAFEVEVLVLLLFESSFVLEFRDAIQPREPFAPSPSRHRRACPATSGSTKSASDESS